MNKKKLILWNIFCHYIFLWWTVYVLDKINNKLIKYENRNIQSKSLININIIVWINETKFIFELEIYKYYDCSKTE